MSNNRVNDFVKLFTGNEKQLLYIFENRKFEDICFHYSEINNIDLHYYLCNAESDIEYLVLTTFIQYVYFYGNVQFTLHNTRKEIYDNFKILKLQHKITDQFRNPQIHKCKPSYNTINKFFVHNNNRYIHRNTRFPVLESEMERLQKLPSELVSFNSKFYDKINNIGSFTVDKFCSEFADKNDSTLINRLMHGRDTKYKYGYNLYGNNITLICNYYGVFISKELVYSVLKNRG